MSDALGSPGSALSTQSPLPPKSQLNSPRPLSTPQISILVPSFNHECTIRQTLDSALAQSFTDFELVIVDDASSDATWALVSSYQDSRIRAFRNSANLGMVPNWNRCLELSSAPFVQFLFADDILAPTCLEKKLGALSAVPDIALAFSASSVIDSNGRPLLHRHPFRHSAVLDGLCLARRSFITKNLYGEPSNVLFRRSCLSRAGGAFRTDLVYSVDWELWLRLSTLGRVAYHSDNLMSFRISPSSVTGSFDWSRFHADDEAFIRHLRASGLFPVSPVAAAVHRTTQTLRMHIRNFWMRCHV